MEYAFVCDAVAATVPSRGHDGATIYNYFYMVIF